VNESKSQKRTSNEIKVIVVRRKEEGTRAESTEYLLIEEYEEIPNKK